MQIIRKLFLKIISFTVLPLLKIYLARPRTYTYKDICLVIAPGVFHPKFFFSTQFLLRYINTLPLKGKTFLELGAGSGLLSFYAHKQGAIVTASDINETAVHYIGKNQESNAVKFEAVQSDLFQKIKPQQFDVIAINPPYYKRNPITEADRAWYCGEQAEYFVHLFSQLADFINSNSLVLMVLSEDCDLKGIKEIAARHNFYFTEVKRKRIWMEMNYVFTINELPHV